MTLKSLRIGGWYRASQAEQILEDCLAEHEFVLPLDINSAGGNLEILENKLIRIRGDSPLIKREAVYVGKMPGVEEEQTLFSYSRYLNKNDLTGKKSREAIRELVNASRQEVFTFPRVEMWFGDGKLDYMISEAGARDFATAVNDAYGLKLNWTDCLHLDSNAKELREHKGGVLGNLEINEEFLKFLEEHKLPSDVESLVRMFANYFGKHPTA